MKLQTKIYLTLLLLAINSICFFYFTIANNAYALDSVIGQYIGRVLSIPIILTAIGFIWKSNRNAIGVTNNVLAGSAFILFSFLSEIVRFLK